MVYEVSNVNEFFAMKSDLDNKNGDKTYKLREICYQTDVVRKQNPRIVEGFMSAY